MRSPAGPHRAELGDTDDPTALVPGAPGALFTYAEQYRDAASGCARAANELARLRQVDGWEGESADAFARRVTTMIKACDDLAEKLNAAAGAWEHYATVLGWGQQKAGDAIAMFAHAAAITAAAAAESPARLGPRGYTGPGTRSLPDPGLSTRSDARALLAYARESVADAAADATVVLRSIAPTAAGGLRPSALASVGNALLEHPDALGQMLGGAALMVGGAALFGGGLAADVTVAGATVGVPANVAGAAAVASGAALAGAGIMNAAAHAAGDSGVSSPSSRDDRTDGRDAKGRFTGKGGRPWVDKEKIGLDETEMTLDDGEQLIRNKVAVRVDGSIQTRYFDGLIKNADGTYTGVEVKSGSAVDRYLANSKNQFAFDSSLSETNSAVGRIDGQLIEVISSRLIRVP
ncbi:putative T7SS-secreted protein [Microbacterium sp. HMWF026]|uniref:putative T7SS-secreted protein n=1 Tax=Microbacterium sp. HMWF026 TaxID=2056861 RepID=UPI0026B74311